MKIRELFALSGIMGAVLWGAFACADEPPWPPRSSPEGGRKPPPPPPETDEEEIAQCASCRAEGICEEHFEKLYRSREEIDRLPPDMPPEKQERIREAFRRRAGCFEKHLKKRFDANGDGELDPHEKELAKRAWAEKHPEAAKRFCEWREHRRERFGAGGGWGPDKREDRRDRREDVRDRAEDRRDRAEDIWDEREDRRDRWEDRKDKREDVRDAAHDGGFFDLWEDRWDRAEDRRDKREDVRDRNEDQRDRWEDRKDKREDVRDRKEDKRNWRKGHPPRGPK